MRRLRLPDVNDSAKHSNAGNIASTDVDPVQTGRYFAPFAEVVELVDALRSGRSGRKPVRVRVPPSACLEVMGRANRNCTTQALRLSRRAFFCQALSCVSAAT